MFLLAACAPTPQTIRLALLAPFEGRYREIGYNALYAARLALSDSGVPNVELLPVDDGGTTGTAQDRARALAGDPQVVGAVVLGYEAAEPETLAAFGDVPVIVVGNWGAEPVSDASFILSDPDIPAQITTDEAVSVTEAARLEAPVIGGEVFALNQFTELATTLEGISILSSGSLPDPDFVNRYQGGDAFAPEPGLLATLTYDAFRLLTGLDARSRPALREALETAEYSGLNGAIRFEDGWWVDAPAHHYYYNADHQLQAETPESRQTHTPSTS